MQTTEAAERRRRNVGADEDEIRLARASMEEAYKGCPAAPVEWRSKERFRKLINDLDMTSSPGYPYLREAPTIGKWLKNDGLGNYDEIQVERLWLDVNRVLAGDYEHLFRVFVKDEPHKLTKVQQGKWRLIVASSLPVQMVWRMCFAHQNDWLNAHPYTTPSAHGLVFCYGGWRRFKQHCKTKGLKFSRDLSAWDLNAPGWVFRVIREVRKSFGGPDDWARTIDMLYEDAYAKSKLIFSNGLVIQQQFDGFMKSGLFNTISDNSLGMVAMHVVASFRARLPVGTIWATGDDVLQEHYSDEYQKALEELGCVVKEVEQSLTFMGTNFDGQPRPMYFSKHVVNFWTQREHREETLDSYARLYCYQDREFRFWVATAAAMGYSLRSQSYYQYWYSSPMARWMSTLFRLG